MSDYHVNIFYSEEDGGYIADIPDLEFCREADPFAAVPTGNLPSSLPGAYAHRTLIGRTPHAISR